MRYIEGDPPAVSRVHGGGVSVGALKEKFRLVNKELGESLGSRTADKGGDKRSLTGGTASPYRTTITTTTTGATSPSSPSSSFAGPGSTARRPVRSSNTFSPSNVPPRVVGSPTRGRTPVEGWRASTFADENSSRSTTTTPAADGGRAEGGPTKRLTILERARARGLAAQQSQR